MANIYRVTIVDKQNKVDIPVGLNLLVRRICNSVLENEEFGHSADISVVFVDNLYIQSLNKQYMGKDYPTDMLSFPTSKDGNYEINPDTGAKILGDIFLSVEKAAEEIKIDNSSFEGKIMYWTAHSLLHLLGYDHEKSQMDDLRMREISEKVVSLVGDPHARYVIDTRDLFSIGNRVDGRKRGNARRRSAQSSRDERSLPSL